MKQYIDKSALVAEIERMLDKYSKLHSFNYGAVKDLESLLNFLDTLEVKEVDLEGELNNWRHEHFHGKRDQNAAGEYLKRNSQLDLAKYFFELGLKVKKENKL